MRDLTCLILMLHKRDFVRVSMMCRNGLVVRPNPSVIDSCYEKSIDQYIS